MAKISIIIPVYNVEKYLSRCLDSLISQTFTDWEAICVDDCSQDGCRVILNQYAQKDSRIKILYPDGRGGVSRARNIALDNACGQWLMFVDSDDFLHPQAMELCIETAEKDNSDIVAFTYDRGWRTALTVRHFLHLKERAPRLEFFNPSRIVSKCFDDIFAITTEYSKPTDMDRRWAIKHCQPWRCLYRSSCIADIRFEPGIIYEDFPWWSEVLLRIGKVSVINLPLYFYYPNFTGYIHSADQSFRIESLQKAIEKAEKLYSEKATEYQKESWRKHFLIPFQAKLKKKIS